jgi:hypothetical protein
MALNDHTADTIDRKINGKAYTDRATPYNDDISLHELRVDQAHGKGLVSCFHRETDLS